ncbi:tumor necrosis factor ligand superfamily member 14 [Amia ocellicauda]|uniref:tumor necrosis factor ligand superfamily member 14 n=1 Tax=Amia ocellicauda TaxID=2972642 RepID=UPI003463AD9E
MADPNIVYPSVFVVDSKANMPLPPEPRRRQKSVAQKLLYLLVSLAVAGMLIEGYFIYRLWMRQPEQVENSDGKVEKMHQEEKVTKLAKMLPKKPAAHVTGCNCSYGEDGKLHWDGVNGDAFTHDMNYRDGSLFIKQEGYYFIYSKIFYGAEECQSARHMSLFKHTVMRSTPRYPSELELMKSKRYYCKKPSEQGLANSFLGGVYHLVDGDQIFVKVEQRKLIRLQSSSENFFGAFLI